MSDPTETIRRSLVTAINAEPGSREVLEAEYGQVYDSDQIREHFEVVGFAAPFMVVRRKIDGSRGSLMFQHSPRFYFDFHPDGGAK